MHKEWEIGGTILVIHLFSDVLEIGPDIFMVKGIGRLTGTIEESDHVLSDT